MRRRDVVGALGLGLLGPHVARAQPSGVARRIGVLMNFVEHDPEALARLDAFRRALRDLGWIDGRNARFEIRYGGGDAERVSRYAGELATLAPDVVLSAGSNTVGPMLQATRSVPVVFVHVPDPVGAGFVSSLARPGGNATGFVNFEYGIGSKWLELLKEVAPNVTRAAIMRDPAISAGIGQFGAVQAVGPSLGLEVTPLPVSEPVEIERALAAFARSPGGGLIITGSALAVIHRDLIIRLAAQHKLPATYFERFFVVSGGLISYGPDRIEQYSRAAGYVDRILRGEKVADLPVQTPTKYEMAVNRTTARALGLTIPTTLLARADEVIE
jgi:putative tryptophan/tyrosine transport system substrate-binding protein